MGHKILWPRGRRLARNDLESMQVNVSKSVTRMAKVVLVYELTRHCLDVLSTQRGCSEWTRGYKRGRQVVLT